MSETRLYKIAIDRAGRPEPGKVSEMLLEFAEPLLYLEPHGPPDLLAFRTCLQLAETCWNLPVMERLGTPSSGSIRSQFEQVLATSPKPIADTLNELVAARKGRFAHIPFLIFSRVEGVYLDDARIVADARQADLPGGVLATSRESTVAEIDSRRSRRRRSEHRD
jgi:hypothetical protein